MTPADLAELLKATAAAVLAERGLDAAALPPTVTVERPRNPEHGDYASNLALQLGKKVGANPRELAGWLADALTQADGIASAEVAGPGFINMRLEASAQAVIVDNVIDAGDEFGSLRRAGGTEDQPRVRLGQPDRARSTSAAPAGRPSATRWAGCCPPRAPTWCASTTSTTTAPRSTGSPASLIAAAKGEPTPADGYAGTYISDIAAQVLQKAPDALSLPGRRDARDLPAKSAST